MYIHPRKPINKCPPAPPIRGCFFVSHPRPPADESFNMTSPAFEVILFDLGGVLVHFDGITPLLALSGNRLEPEDARRFWLKSPSVRRFETGRCTPEEFALGAVAELGLALAPALFLEQ